MTTPSYLPIALPAGDESPVIVEVAYGADLTAHPATWPWVDYSRDVLGAVAIRQGKRPNTDRTEPSSCPLRLDSPDGRHHPLLPTGPNYPHVRRNTPVRVRLRPEIAEYAVVTRDTFSRTVADHWDATDDGYPWTLTGLGGTVTDADFDVNGTAGTMSIPVANADRRAMLETLGVVDQDITATVSVALPTGAGVDAGLFVRWSDFSNYYFCGAAIATSGAVTVYVTQVAAGVSNSLANVVTTITHAAGTPLTIRVQAYDGAVRLKAWQGDTEPTTWHIDVADPDPVVGDGMGLYGLVRTGNTNAKPLVFTWDNLIVGQMPVRFGGFADDYRPEWPAGDDSRAEVNINASGILRRLGQGSKPLRSPVYLNVMSAVNDPYRVAYWPMEEGTRATQIASPMPGVAPMAVAGTINFGSYDSPGSDRLPVLGAGATFAAQVPVYPEDNQTKIVNLWAIPAAGLPDLTVLLRLSGTGTVARWDLIYGTINNGAIRLAAYNSVGALIDQTAFAFTDLDGEHFLTSLELVTDGADIDILMLVQRIRVDDPQGSSLIVDTFTGHTAGRISSFVGTPAGAADGLVVGHMAVSNLTAGLANLGDAIVGHATETAADRFLRLCAQEGILARVEANTDTAHDTVMGPQPTGTLLALLRECETTDFGVLDEQPFGLRFVARGARYNQPVALALTTEQGQVKEPFKPAYDDRDLLNDVEARRPDGSTARFEATGTLGPGPSTGRYDGGIAANTHTDDPLDEIAAWAAHLGTVDQYRIPALRWDLASHPELIGRWLAADITSRLTARVQLAQFPQVPIDEHLDGYTETFDAGPVWTVEGNGSPAAPWTVAVIEGTGAPEQPPWRLDTGGSAAVAPLTETATSAKLTTLDGPEWTTTAEHPTDFNFDVDIDGEQVTVTAISTDTAAFIAAGTVAHADNTDVTPGLPAGMTTDVGQVLILIAAIRNSGTGTVDDMPNWRDLAEFGNLRVFGRYYVNGDTAPGVSFSGGVAGATCSARVIGLSGVSLELDDGRASASDPSPRTQLNGSATTVAYPSLSVRRDGSVVLLIGWRQDDHSGVTAEPGFAEAFDSFTSTGDDQSLFCQYQIQGTAADIPADSVATSGGVSTISRAIVLALRPLQTATLVRSVNGALKAHAAGTAVTLHEPPVIAL